MGLIDAMRTNDTITENGMGAHSTTLNNCVDLFSQIGSLRGKDRYKKINIFTKALSENPEIAMKVLFWARDIRGGSGERQTFKDIIMYLSEYHHELIEKNIHLIPEYGRWDDILVLLDTRLEKNVLKLIEQGLNDGNQLCAKWLPRPNVKNHDKKRWSKKITKHLGLNPKEYRRLIVDMSSTVEQLMCSNEWDSIKYEHVPSKAMSNYMKSFGKHNYESFTKYLDTLKDGKTKINTGAVYPYDILKNLRSGHKEGANLQWDSLPNYLKESKETILPIVDVSGSMYWSESKISGDLYAGDVAISMGLYISERNDGPFKNSVIDFSTNPKLSVLGGTLLERYNQIDRIGFGGSTNIVKTFNLILDSAVRNGIKEEDMPTMLLIFSDMQFDSANGGGGYYDNNTPRWNPTVQEVVERKYKEVGYKIPKLVYWQLNARNSNQPVQYNEEGTAIVSGFSPALLTNLLSGKDITPYKVMMDTVGGNRYSRIRV